MVNKNILFGSFFLEKLLQSLWGMKPINTIAEAPTQPLGTSEPRK